MDVQVLRAEVIRGGKSRGEELSCVFSKACAGAIEKGSIFNFGCTDLQHKQICKHILMSIPMGGILALVVRMAWFTSTICKSGQ